MYVESDVILSKLSFYVIYALSRCNVAPIWFSIYVVLYIKPTTSTMFPSYILYNIQNTCGDTERNNVTKKKLLAPLGNTLIRSTLIIRT